MSLFEGCNTSGADDYGKLELGRQADLVVFDADPVADIANTLDIERVMQGGEWLDRAALMTVP